ncbi:MAG: hypothetical protein J7L15_01635, partial [Clostridiales bacterium]|nr:hypothetical protein [Clostridiales bacterium]
MSLLVFKKEELEVLSLVNGKKINSFSVLNGIEGFNKESFAKKKEAHLAIINDFIEDGAIWKTKDGKPHLIRELQGVFTIINSPKRTIKIKTASKQPIGEHYYCTIDDLGAIFSVGKDEVFYTIAYPFDEKLLSTWFNDEIIGDLGVEKEKHTNVESILSNAEFSILSILIMNNSYAKSINRDYLLRTELLDSTFLDYVHANNILNIDIDSIRDIIKNSDVSNILSSLEEKNILKINQEKIYLDETLSNAFSTDNLREIVEFTEITPFMRSKNLYITNTGYMILEPVLSKPLKWKLSIEDLTIPSIDLI